MAPPEEVVLRGMQELERELAREFEADRQRRLRVSRSLRPAEERLARLLSSPERIRRLRELDARAAAKELLPPD